MPARNEDLHGMVPDKCPVALILLDVINDLEWPGGEKLLPFALDMASKLSSLIGRARDAGIPIVYVNDNYGRWQSDFAKLIDHCINDDVRGQPIVEQLRPQQDDYFVLKPKHSGFFSTTLDVLLDYLKAKRLIITGIAGNICVLFTANDAYMRDFELYVPADCTCSNSAEINDIAVDQMKTVLKADVTNSTDLDVRKLADPAWTRKASEQAPEPETPEFATRYHTETNR